MYNLGIIAGAVFLMPHLGVIGLALGVVLGALLHMAPSVSRRQNERFPFHFTLDFKNSSSAKSPQTDDFPGPWDWPSRK